MSSPGFIPAAFPGGCGIRGLTTTRAGGASQGPYKSLNLATHVGDDPSAVADNRRRLAHALGLASAPAWLEQVHGTRVVELVPGEAHDPCAADAAVCRVPGVVLAVLTADCLPVLLADPAAGVIGIAHAGWRGLAAGVLENTVVQMGSRPAELHAWIGPAIGSRHFEVGADVYDVFTGQHQADGDLFVPATRGKWLANLPGLARARLRRLGLVNVIDSGHCTYSSAERFFSYRRDGECGRMASLLWLEP